MPYPIVFLLYFPHVYRHTNGRAEVTCTEKLKIDSQKNTKNKHKMEREKM